MVKNDEIRKWGIHIHWTKFPLHVIHELSLIFVRIVPACCYDLIILGFVYPLPAHITNSVPIQNRYLLIQCIYIAVTA